MDSKESRKGIDDDDENNDHERFLVS